MYNARLIVATVAKSVAEERNIPYGNSIAYNDVANVAKVASGVSENRIPLRSSPLIQTEYPSHAFGPFAQAVKSLSTILQVPEAMAGASILTSLAFCAQGLANVLTRDGRVIPTSIYCLTVADSGDRKSAVDDVVSQPIMTVEREQYTAYQWEMQAYEQAKKDYEQRPKKEKELFSFDREQPKNPAMIVENVNAEGLFRAYKEGRPSLALFSDEGGTLFGGNAFQKENALKSITFFSKLWDGSSVDKIRSGEGFSRLYDRRLSMHLMVQPAIAESILNDELFQGQGFLPRFLISWPQTLKGSRKYEDTNARTNAAIMDFYHRCDTILRTPLNIEEGTGALIFDTMTIASDAHALWVQHYNMIEGLLIPDGSLSIVSANASKCAEQTIRIAGVLTLVENHYARIITAETMANAILISQWYLKEALRLRQNGCAPQEILEAEMLMKWLDTKNIRYFSVRHIVRKGPNKLRLKKKAEQAIRILEEHNQIFRGLGSIMIDGVNTKTFWERVP
ncbi:MAG: YfjI family protein, partial [Pseudomonadota bacterium]